MPLYVGRIFKRVAYNFKEAEDSLEQLWQARGIDPGLLPDARAVLLASLLRAPDEIRSASIRRISQTIRRIKPCGTERCDEPRPVWWILLGFNHSESWFQHFLTIALLIYNVIRAILTYFVSSMRDSEDRSGYSPGLVEYRLLSYFYWPMYILVTVAASAFLLHAQEYLFKLSIILPSQ